MNPTKLPKLAAFVGGALCLALLPRPATAGDDAPPSASAAVAADALYAKGRRLFRAGSTAVGCDKLRASFDIDPAIGTAMLLGDCLSKLGKLASAWSRYNSAYYLAKKAGRTARALEANHKANALQPLLPTLSVSVPVANRVEGLSVRSDGVVLAPAAWEVKLPVDPGPRISKGSLVKGVVSTEVTRLAPSGAEYVAFAVGTSPGAMAFDGGNMWIANYGSDNVTKLSSSGATLGTFAVGKYPSGIAFDGTNMWVVNSGSNTVTELSPSGAVLGAFAVGADPNDIASDGAHMWVTNAGDGTVTEL